MTILKLNSTKIKENFYLKKDYNVFYTIYFFTIVFAFFVDTPEEIKNGLVKIYTGRDILITDYVALGGVGATLLNAGLCSILVLSIYKFQKLKLNGSLIMSVWLVTGFAMFGKNLFNMLPMYLGSYIYAKFQDEPFSKYTLTATVTTTLAPIVTEMFYLPVPFYVRIMLSIIVGAFAGFIMHPISSYLMRVHGGFILYNSGFAAGVIGTLFMGVLRILNLENTARFYWSTDYRAILSLYIFIVCIYLITVGLIFGEENEKKLGKIYKSSGRLVTDFYAHYKYTAFVNMGVIGLFALIVCNLLTIDINGATISGIFAIVGFGAFGKHLKNITPVMVGAILAGTVVPGSITSPSISLAILFCTSLAPIAGTFGVLEGIFAGILHILFVTNIGSIHGGVNLYNNGFATGFVAMTLVPLITGFRKGDYN